MRFPLRLHPAWVIATTLPDVRASIPTGLRVATPEGCEMQIRPSLSTFRTPPHAHRLHDPLGMLLGNL